MNGLDICCSSLTMMLGPANPTLSPFVSSHGTSVGIRAPLAYVPFFEFWSVRRYLPFTKSILAWLLEISRGTLFESITLLHLGFLPTVITPVIPPEPCSAMPPGSFESKGSADRRTRHARPRVEESGN